MKILNSPHKMCLKYLHATISKIMNQSLFIKVIVGLGDIVVNFSLMQTQFSSISSIDWMLNIIHWCIVKSTVFTPNIKVQQCYALEWNFIALNFASLVKSCPWVDNLCAYVDLNLVFHCLVSPKIMRVHYHNFHSFLPLTKSNLDNKNELIPESLREHVYI